jgi:cobalt-zinc-cadmium efflux system membrane fusion protein
MSIRLVALVVVAAAFVYGVRTATTAPPEPSGRPATSAASETLEDGTVKLSPGSQSFVEVQTVGDAGGGNTVTSPARVDFRDGAVAQIGVPLAGRVVTVHVKVGDYVRQGDALLTLDCPEAASTRAAVQQTQATLREARATLDRQTRMMAEGVGVERERLAAETRVSELEAELARQQAAAAFAGAGAGTAVVVQAPIGGTVITRKASPGLTMQPGGEPGVEIGDPAAVWVVADVFERDLQFVREAAGVQVRLESVDGVLDGHVMSVGTVVAAGLRTAPVRIAVDGKGHVLRPGMFGKVSIEAASSTMSLPTEAVLVRDGKESVVFVEKAPLTYVRRTVVVAQHVADGRVQIVSGLDPGEKVVVKGALLLDGAADLLL